jgi:SAM-dependent MidA family methyltransferase
MTKPLSLPTPMLNLVEQRIQSNGGWMAFDEFMSLALYAPGLGYYANDLRKFGATAASGSDFVTAPELSPWFGRTLARQLSEALVHTQTDQIWEFGAGSGALAEQLLQTLGDAVNQYTIVDLSGSLRQRQQERLAVFGHKVRWVDALPESISGVIVGNEVLDAMPVKLIVRLQGQWHERGVVWTGDAAQPLGWQDRLTSWRPPIEIPGEHDYLTEIHPQAEGFVRTLADKFKVGVQSTGKGGAAFFIDYGFSESEYFHVQRHMGTLMCHKLHQADPDPLQEVGLKDITAHVNFTGIALAAQDAGLSVMGYTTQGRFLINCGLLEPLAHASLAERAMAQKLITEHEMGELFKVIALGTKEWEPLGFAQGDRTHTL